MSFSHRIAALTAVVAIPLGIAATSYALTDSPESPKVPAKVELDKGDSPSRTPSKKPTPSDEVVSRPPVTDDDNSDDGGAGGRTDDGAGGRTSGGGPGGAADDDGPGDDGSGDDDGGAGDDG
ncbi:small secreted hydrophilic protein [Streptomyces xiangluensis]|uniref:Small secreted hydrophilic protein n=1 Tax=Streptomyces xiangluensis TaxID=2665720 RepID=A0ABV8YU51_9ACTN